MKKSLISLNVLDQVKFKHVSNPLKKAILATICAVIMGAPAPLLAQERSNKAFEMKIGPAPKFEASSQDSTMARRIDLQLGKSILVDLPRDAKEVFVANPGIANALVRSSRKIYVIAVATGSTTIFVNDSEGKQIAVLDMTVAKELGKELNVLRDLMRTTFPTAQIDVRSVGNSFVLSGFVDSPLEAQRAVDIATTMTAGLKSSDGNAGTGGQSSTSVVNALQVRGRDQVMIKVTIAEVQKTILKRLGLDVSGTWKVGASSFGLNSAAEGANPLTVKNLDFSRTGSSAGTATIRALEQQGAFHTLAEPTLTAISGESAKFLAGGEVPIVVRSCSPTNGCTDTITYKPVGVSLAFTPVVMSEGRISLHVSTEVTERDDNNSVFTNGLNVPGFKTRRTETTVELPSGGSMATAGLIQQSSGVTTNGLPGLMNIPILGALARSREFQRKETELLIVLTPYIVKPTEQKNLPRPDDGFVDASDPAGMFLGRVNKLYGVSGNSRNLGSYRGNVGFITE
jgi:pilus assembly protein CpaC